MIEKVRKYSESFAYEHLHSVYQFIRKFKWSYDGERLMKQLIEEIDKEMQDKAEAGKRQRKRYYQDVGMSTEDTPVQTLEEQVDNVQRLKEDMSVKPIGLTVGFCPKCGSRVEGMPTPSCGKAKNGRHFYKECIACDYYSEIWKRGNKFTETEGG